MYDALKAQGYTDDKIYFLAQGPVKVDPEWNREGEVKLQRLNAGVVDGVTSQESVSAVFAELAGLMTERDSLFVFVLAHGSKKKIAMGKSLPDSILKRKSTSIGYAMRGRRDKMSSEVFAQAAVGSQKACEIMIMFDSCYSGSHEPALRAAYDPERIKRLEVAHSTDGKTRSYGADMRHPVNKKYRAYYDLDYRAVRTRVADGNPTDHGGEFSSGIIASMFGGIFRTAYTAGVGLDAAKANKMTKPSIWRVGESGPCVVIPDPVTDPPRVDPPLIDPEPGDEPEEPEEPVTPPVTKKKIQVIPHGGSYISLDQVKLYTPSDCPACEEDHWHAVSGTAKTIAGQIVIDPYADCGLGTVREHPVTEVEIE